MTYSRLNTRDVIQLVAVFVLVLRCTEVKSVMRGVVRGAGHNKTRFQGWKRRFWSSYDAYVCGSFGNFNNYSLKYFGLFAF